MFSRKVYSVLYLVYNMFIIGLIDVYTVLYLTSH